MEKILIIILQLLTKIKEMADALLKIIVPVSMVMVAADILFGTTFGVLERALLLLQKVGVTGNILTIIIVVAIILWFSDKKK